MRVALLVLAALVGTACDSQHVVPGSLPLSHRLDSLTHRDAGVLAFRHTLATGDSTTVDLDPDLLRGLYLAVGRVRLSEHAGIVEGIHAPLSPSPFEVGVLTEAGAGWSAAWASGQTRTGFVPVDALIERYHLRLAAHYSFPFGETGVLASPRPVNTLALGRAFAEVETVRSGYSESHPRGSRDIEAERRNGAWRLDFSIGEGDCPRGCLSRTYWTFRIRDGGGVEYLGTRDG